MITKQEREKLFRKELQELLNRHGAEMYVTDDHRPYGMHSGICEVSIDAKYNDEFNCTHEFTEFNL